MAANNLKDFTVDWVLFGLLFFSLLSFAVIFVANNNPDALGDSQDKFDTYSSDVNSKLILVEDESNALLNISALSNPEESFLGSRDSVATSYGLTGTGKGFIDSFKLFMGWVLSGAIGKLLTGVLVGLFGLTSIFFITKWIRTGT